MSGSPPGRRDTRALSINQEGLHDIAYFKPPLVSAACLLPVLCGAQASLDGTWAICFSTRDDETRQAVVTIAGA